MLLSSNGAPGLDAAHIHKVRLHYKSISIKYLQMNHSDCFDAQMFILASSSNMISPLFLGLVLDRFGPRACSVTSVAFSTLGFFLFGTAAMLAPALASSSMTGLSREDLFSLSVAMIGFGGPGVQNAVIHTANLFPSNKGLVTAIITGCFQLSFIIFFVFDQV
jgi:MFS family permease